LDTLFDGVAGKYGVISQSPFDYLDAQVRKDALALDPLPKQIPPGDLIQCSDTCDDDDEFCQDACACVAACSTNTTCTGDCGAVYNEYWVFDWLHGIALEYQACIYGESIETNSAACNTFMSAWNDNTWNTNGNLVNCAKVQCFKNNDCNGNYGRVTNYCVEDGCGRMLRQRNTTKRNLQGGCPADSFCGNDYQQFGDCV